MPGKGRLALVRVDGGSAGAGKRSCFTIVHFGQCGRWRGCSTCRRPKRRPWWCCPRCRSAPMECRASSTPCTAPLPAACSCPPRWPRSPRPSRGGAPVSARRRMLAGPAHPDPRSGPSCDRPRTTQSIAAVKAGSSSRLSTLSLIVSFRAPNALANFAVFRCVFLTDSNSTC